MFSTKTRSTKTLFVFKKDFICWYTIFSKIFLSSGSIQVLSDKLKISTNGPAILCAASFNSLSLIPPSAEDFLYRVRKRKNTITSYAIVISTRCISTLNTKKSTSNHHHFPQVHDPSIRLHQIRIHQQNLKSLSSYKLRVAIFRVFEGRARNMITKIAI